MKPPVSGRLTLRKLRAYCPEWTWVAERNGSFGGWDYLGTRGEQTVRVYHVAVPGLFYDDCESSARVEVGPGKTEEFSVWWIKVAPIAGAEGAPAPKEG